MGERSGNYGGGRLVTKGLCIVIAGWTAIILAASGYVQTAGAQPSSRLPQSTSEYRAVLDEYCVVCHNEKLRTAGLMLDRVDLRNVSESGEVWEKVARKLRTGEMPPAGRPRPDEPTYNAFASWLETSLDAAAAAKPNPGMPAALHRLNRTEYHNAIRDVLKLEIDVASLLPPDDASYGFDNIADALGVSPVLLERYLSAARKISSIVIGAHTPSPSMATYRVSSDVAQDDRLDGLPFGTRGGTLIHHYFPLDGEYVFKIRLARTSITDMVAGLTEPHQIELSVDGERMQLFTVGGELPSSQGETQKKNEDESQKDDSYLIPKTDDAGLQVRVPVKAGPRVVQVAFIKKNSAQVELKGNGLDWRRPFMRPDANVDYTKGQPYLASVGIGGPYGASGAGDTPSRRRIFVCRPASRNDEAACAKKILLTLGRRAYRRTVTDLELQDLLSFYEEGRTKGEFETGIERALRRLLVSPAFLFRVERDPANIARNVAYRISDVELASRLSFFLWSSIPDDELLDLASRGTLRNPTVFEQQVRRMLADGRTQALTRNFAGQWLYLRNVTAVTPDWRLFPDFDHNLRQAFRRETELFFESILREDRSVTELLTANHTFVNERLARHYGIPHVYGDYFRRITLSDDKRHGLLGQGSILTVTSYPTRTSPVLRGKWIMENILGTPPPPPPPNVPDLEDTNPDGKVLSMRERMVQHRANPVCASCHSRMDPLGLAMENFDAVGMWRTRDESNTAIDASGVLPDGTHVDGPAGLRQALLRHPDRFVTTLTEKLLTYALGRGLEYYDQPAVRTITREAARSDYRFSALITAIVESTPFQMRRSQS